MSEGRDVERGRRLLIPPFLSPRQEGRRASRGERRVKVRSGDVEEGTAKLGPALHEELERPAEIELVAPGGSSHEKRRVLKVAVDDKLAPNEVVVSAQDLKALGVAENTVVTVRRR